MSVFSLIPLQTSKYANIFLRFGVIKSGVEFFYSLVDFCSQCKTGAKCVLQDNAPVCVCPEGFEGTHCKTGMAL